MDRVSSIFEGCYEANRAASLAGVPISTVYDWARKGIVSPSVSKERPKLWSYGDLMSLRIVYWLRHPKHADRVPASPMSQVRRALVQLEAQGVDLWSVGEGGHASPLCVDRTGQVIIREKDQVRDLAGQGPLASDLLDVLGPFDVSADEWGPDLRRPMPHLRIVPGKVSGEPHLEHSRLTTSSVVALADRGFTLEDIRRLYPDESPEALREAIELEHRLAA
ncbi:MAG: DUF433 domain-containing protein [Acidimicrobiales bacterium]|nr:DUF433 domain-containing protein [Acidimicrobiales bacterium]